MLEAGCWGGRRGEHTSPACRHAADLFAAVAALLNRLRFQRSREPSRLPGRNRMQHSRLAGFRLRMLSVVLHPFGVPVHRIGCFLVHLFCV